MDQATDEFGLLEAVFGLGTSTLTFMTSTKGVNSNVDDPHEDAAMVLPTVVATGAETLSVARDSQFEGLLPEVSSHGEPDVTEMWVCISM
eukprot:2870311-Amphidinium_carterae.1